VEEPEFGKEFRSSTFLLIHANEELNKARRHFYKDFHLGPQG